MEKKSSGRIKKNKTLAKRDLIFSGGACGHDCNQGPVYLQFLLEMLLEILSKQSSGRRVSSPV